MFYMSACYESLYKSRYQEKYYMHCFDTDSSCSQFDEDLDDGMPLLISFSSFSVCY
jgi:hypothetical protein